MDFCVHTIDRENFKHFVVNFKILSNTLTLHIPIFSNTMYHRCSQMPVVSSLLLHLGLLLIVAQLSQPVFVHLSLAQAHGSSCTSDFNTSVFSQVLSLDFSCFSLLSISIITNIIIISSAVHFMVVTMQHLYNLKENSICE